MDIRVLRYYLAVCQEGTMSRAAETLHVTQPTLSRQIADLERELGCVLLERGGHRVHLTEKGLYLRRRAEEIVSLADQTTSDIRAEEGVVEGDVYIAAGESPAFSTVASAIRDFRELYPHVQFHVHSGVSSDAIWRLEHGTADLAVLVSQPDTDDYDTLRLAATDVYVVYLPAHTALAQKEVVTPDDLVGPPLIVSEQAIKRGVLPAWFGDRLHRTNIVATFNLFYNAAILARERVGYVLTLEGVVPAGDEGMTTRPLYPPVVSPADIAWKRDQPLSVPAAKFLEFLRGRPDVAQQDGRTMGM